MTQENKELLIKDLCGRLPYGVKVQYKDGIFDIDNISSIYEEVHLDIVENYTIDISEIKPYLFPLSSMSEEQKKYISDRWGVNEDFDFEIDPNWGEYLVDLGDVVDYVNWLIENHFDFNWLIPKGLAIDATGLNIY